MDPNQLGREESMNSKSLILNLVLLALGGILLAAPLPTLAVENAAEKKIYPPYPDVWGREMPIPKDVTGLVSTGSGSTDLFEGPDGQILIDVTYWQTADQYDGVLTTFLYDFFSGRIVNKWRGKISRISAKWAFIRANG
jgi:hypothetical protein